MALETHSSQERWALRDEGSSSSNESDDEPVKSSMMIDGKGRPRGRIIGSQWSGGTTFAKMRQELQDF